MWIPSGKFAILPVLGIAAAGYGIYKTITTAVDVYLAHQQQTQIENFINDVNPNYRADLVYSGLGDYANALRTQAINVPLTSFNPPPASAASCPK